MLEIKRFPNDMSSLEVDRADVKRVPPLIVGTVKDVSHDNIPVRAGSLTMNF